MKEDKLMQLQDKIGYHFQNLSLLNNALTHSSYANERHWKYERNNERLEFLGDAVLELVSSDYIFSNHKDMVEGKMTKLRASLVCEMSLASSAREIELGEYLKLGHGEWVTGGGKRDSILSDAFEAVIGAIYLDGGLANAKEFIHKYILTDIEHKQLFYDSKTILQEVVQGEHEQLTYVLTDESGPDHNKSFTVRACIGERVIGSGTGHTKKAAEQEAAYQALLMLKNQQRG